MRKRWTIIKVNRNNIILIDESTEFLYLKKKRNDDESWNEDNISVAKNKKDIPPKNYINNNTSKNKSNIKKKEIKNKVYVCKGKRTQKDKANELLEDSFLLNLERKPNPKIENHPQVNSRVIQKSEDFDPERTRVIIHGDDYVKTSSEEDFMKYNFNFVLEEQYKTERLIINKENQHVDLKTKNSNRFFLSKHIHSQEDTPKICWNPIKFGSTTKVEINSILKEIEIKWSRITKQKFNEEIALQLLQMNELSVQSTLSFMDTEDFKTFLKSKLLF